MVLYLRHIVTRLHPKSRLHSQGNVYLPSLSVVGYLSDWFTSDKLALRSLIGQKVMSKITCRSGGKNVE